MFDDWLCPSWKQLLQLTILLIDLNSSDEDIRSDINSGTSNNLVAIGKLCGALTRSAILLTLVTFFGSNTRSLILLILGNFGGSTTLSLILFRVGISINVENGKNCLW